MMHAITDPCTSVGISLYDTITSIVLHTILELQRFYSDLSQQLYPLMTTAVMTGAMSVQK